jgi:hypothetical protein
VREQLVGSATGGVDEALRVVATGRNAEKMLAAVGALAGNDDPRVRPALLARYVYLAERPTKRDPSSQVRAAILRALRFLALPEDAELLGRAAMTVEILPSSGEVAAGLRAAALVTLNEVDPPLASFHAARLLVDPHTQPMSGAPALTAAQVLAAQGQTLPLYAHAAGEATASGEVLAECLRSLVELPASLLDPLIDRYRESRDDAVLLGLFDLLLARPDRQDHAPTVLGLVRETRVPSVFRALVAGLVASRDETLVAELRAMAEAEDDPARREILREALALA